MTLIAFINYRRDDSAPQAKLLADAVQNALSSDAVFMDTESIDLGSTWPDRIRIALEKSRFVVVVIGTEWLRAGMNEWGQRRIDNPADWVRLEIAAALADTRKTVIPVLVDKANMPPPDVLPECVAQIASRQAVEIRRDYWDHDVKLLITKIAGQKDGNPIARTPLIDSFWDNLSPSLQDAIMLAANAARREGKHIISTRTLFAAMHRLNPDRLPEFFDLIPRHALPEPISEEITADSDAISGIRLFSDCIQDSLNHLTPQSSADNKITTEDIFVDIARHGTGASVRRLRTNGISVDRINEIVQQLGWSVMAREAV